MRLLLALLIVAATAPAAGAATRLNLSGGPAHAIAAGPQGAYVVVDSGDPARPFELVRSTGRSRAVIGRFGAREARFPDVAVGGGDVGVVYGRPVSGGVEITFRAVRDGGLGAARPLMHATGPGELALRAGRPLIAYPDLAGDIALGDAPAPPERSPYAMTEDAPHTRHLPLDLAIGPRGPLVLDVAQRPGRTELRVLGDGAPARPVLVLGRLRDLEASLAVDGRRVYVAYTAAGRAVLATASGGSRWRRRRMPGRGVEGAPAVVRRGSSTLVAYSRRVRGGRDIYVARSGGGTRRLTRGGGDDQAPLAAAFGGRAYVAWTSVPRGSSRGVPLLASLP